MDKKEELRNKVINVHHRLGTEAHITAEEMDTERLNTITYDYLCRLEEAKSWIGEITQVPESYEEFEEEMRKGFFLSEVAKHYTPSVVGTIFIDSTLQYRHTDNINYFLRSLNYLGLPKYFYFEVIDLYEKKNFPKVVYCIHALAHFLRSKGMSGGIVSAAGKVFNAEDIERMDQELSNIKMPRFDNIQNDIANRKESEEEEDLEDLRNKARAKLLEEENLLIETIDRESELKDEKLPAEDIITLKFKSFLYAKAFDNIYYKNNISLFSIRKFLFIFFKTSFEMLKEKRIDDLHKSIFHKMKEIYNKEIYLEDIENRISLMIHNKLNLYKIKYNRTIDEDFNLKPVQDILQILQTSPYLLSQLFTKVDDKENFISTLILPLFNNISGKKEEYLFINLVLEIMKIHQANDYEDDNLSYRLMVNYFRVSKEGEIFKQGLYNIVKNLENIEVECNPTEIHRFLYDTVKSLDESLDNKRVQEVYETRLGIIRGVLKSIFDFLQNNINNFPFILRYFLSLHGTENFLKDFVFPFFVAGDVFDSKYKISNLVRNKAYKITNLISWFTESFTMDGETDLIPEDMTVYVPILDCLKDCYIKFQNTIKSLVSVQSLDHYFQFESINELVRVQKSMIYLPVRVVNGLMILIKNNEELFDPYLVEELELFPDENNIILTFSFLSSDWVNEADERVVALENFIKNTKRKLIYLIKICKGRNVLDLILGDSSEAEKALFEEEKNFNCSSKQYDSDYECASRRNQTNLEEESLDDLKESLIDDFKFLEEKGIVSRDNLYAEILHLLAQDIILLKFMSVERSKELKVNELTYNNLLAKEEYLDAKVAEYDTYIDSYCSSMAIKKASYDNNSPIVKLNKESKFGSYYFSSTELTKLNILNQVFDVPDSRDIFFILVSNKPLVFGLEVYINNLLISNPYDFRFEDILAMKRNKNETFNVLNICSFNTDNFIKLLNDKYILFN